MRRLRSLRARRAARPGPLPDGGPRTGSANPQSLKNLPKNWSLRGRLTAHPGLAVGRALDHAARRARSTTLEKSQRTGGMGHISAFALPNSKSWRCKIRAIFCSIDLAYLRDASRYSFCVNSGVSEGPHLEIGMKMERDARDRVGGEGDARNPSADNLPDIFLDI